ncbi:IclR family transcriptional regulator [Sphingomonas canadensis]|uniref:IclR family transcriptional regulator n=1 Tax=Sphingomonas canadensis TaxID=1219257 RepID=A0ABW3H8W7_9SPHN|nr:IclR family transcriptional regulator [Sphingomonas canadensis]MCW3837638.1 IclR family transcriptional regulator [Sphingomonas canadensis]
MVPKGAADRLAYLLKLIASGPPRFALGELALRADLPVSSVHRLLQVMLRSGLVERGAGQSYRPGRELHRLASQLVARFDLGRSARPLLQDLVEQFHETAVLCVYSPAQRRAIISEMVHTPHPLRFAVERGGEISLPWGSLGRAVLAFLPPGEIEAVMRENSTGPLTGRARSTRKEMEAELAAIRVEGVARYYDPAIDIAGVSGPVFGAEREILGCIGVTMPSKRYQLHLEDDLALAVRGAARRLSEMAAISHS